MREWLIGFIVGSLFGLSIAAIIRSRSKYRVRKIFTWYPPKEANDGVG